MADRGRRRVGWAASFRLRDRLHPARAAERAGGDRLMRIAVDVGGTFTDVVVLGEAAEGLRHEKVETFPADPASGVLAGFAKAGADLGAVDFFVHGTTLGINALLTRTGAR